MKRSALMILLVILLSGGVVYLAAENLIRPSHPYIQYFGRWDRTDSTRAAHSWPGVYICAKFEGTSIGVRFFDNFTFYNVFIDSQYQGVFRGDYYGEKTYTLISNLQDTVHTIMLTKRCETSWAKFTFYGFVLDNGKTLLPPDEPPIRKIEFVGDSYTSASGNEYTEEGTPPNTELVTNAYDSFGAIVARHYGAQYTLTSCSGYGMVLDWQGNYANNIPDHYDRALLYTTNPKWDYSEWQPDLIVVGLGLNDYSGYGGWEGQITAENTAEYKSRYHTFIQNLRDYYPGVKILAVATHVEWMRTTIAEIVDEELAAGHQDVFYAQYSYYPGGYVNNGHPNVATHYKIADELIAAIDTIDAWQPAVDNLPPRFMQLPQSPFIVSDTTYNFRIETDSYATVRFSKSDRPYEQMEFEFANTGQRVHKTTVSCQQGQVNTYYLRARDLSGNVMDTSAIVVFTVDTMLAPVRWMNPIYPTRDESWQTGAAPLGYGYTDAKTKIARVKTAYYRKYFDITAVASVGALTLDLYYNDAAAVYLNGREIERFNLNAEDTLRYETSAVQSKVGIVSYALTDAELKLLRCGQNLLAVEVHQYSADTTNLYFNCRLTNTTGGVHDVVFDLGADWRYFDNGICPPDYSRDSLAITEARPVVKASQFALLPNYPNPFNSVTVIRFWLGLDSEVSLEVYDCRGFKVETLVNKRLAAGEYAVNFKCSDLTSGIYFYRLISAGQTKTGKMLLLK